MTTEFQERRQHPRVAAGGDCQLRTARHVRVRLLDISSGGALVATDEALPVGLQGRLRLMFGATPFETTVEVRREEPSSEGRGRLAGVSMPALQRAEQDTLDEFLGRAGS